MKVERIPIEVQLPGDLVSVAGELLDEWAEEVGGKIIESGGCDGCECGECWGRPGEPAWFGHITSPVGARINEDEMERHVAMLLSLWLSERDVFVHRQAEAPRHRRRRRGAA